MSQNPNKQTARERMLAERRRQRQTEARRRKIVTAVGVTAGLLLAGGVAIAVATAGSGSAAQTSAVVPAHASGPDGTLVVYGRPSAPNTLDVWEDFRCPVCDALEKADGPVIQQLADNGTYKIQYHMAAFLDDNLGGKGSKTALAAAGAALNEGVGKFKQFHDLLYANQPDEHTDTFGDTGRLLDLAAKVPGLKTPAFVKAVKDGTYQAWAGKVAAAFNSSGVTGTPTLRLNGQPLTVFDAQGTPLTPDRYTAAVRQVIAATKK